MFIIIPGKYTIPNFGKLDTSKEVTNDDKFKLYLNESFPFITITKKSIDFFKKKKLDKKIIEKLINSAVTIEEVEILLQIKKHKTLQIVAEKKIEAFKK